MDRREQSREEWEQELTDVQRNLTPAGDIRSTQIISKKLAATPAPIQDVAHLLGFILSAVLLMVGLMIFNSDVPHKAAIGLVILISGCALGIAMFRWKRKS